MLTSSRPPTEVNRSMKILLCHNYYQQPGGEDGVLHDERWLLESRGHQVVEYTQHNDDLENMSRAQMVKRTFWNSDVYNEISRLIQSERPDVMHCHNTFPLISPAAYGAARDQSLAVVQTLHNFRLLCPNAQLLRDGKVCEACIGGTLPWRSVVHGCYRGSRSATAVVAAMLTAHRLRKTWTREIDRYIALTEFGRDKFIAGGLPAERIRVKPNFVREDPGVGRGDNSCALFVGRLSEEKGIHTMLQAWQQRSDLLPLKIIGDGPLAETVQQAARNDHRITWLGRQPADRVLQEMGAAICLLVPSIWYETFGRIIAEAFATGTPVIGSNHGAMSELIDHERTGLLFEPGNADSLSDAVSRLQSRPESWPAMRQSARDEYEALYTPEVNVRQLIDIYEDAIRAAAARHRTPQQPEPVEATPC